MSIITHPEKQNSTLYCKGFSKIKVYPKLFPCGWINQTKVKVSNNIVFT